MVTSRPIPPEATSPTEESASAVDGDAHLQTVNPSLLEKTADSHHHASLKNDTRRDQGIMDVLQRARQMGMKIWALEKLQRMITTINDNDLGAPNETAARSKTVGGNTTNGKGDNDLSRLLRQELVNGPSDRDPLSSMEMIVFKGPFIYIHDMNEKTKPVLAREYSRVNRRQDGSWPQFRSAPLGKCPFIDEPPSRKDYDRQRMRQVHKEKKAAKANEARANPSAVAVPDRTIDTKPAPEPAKTKQPEEKRPSPQFEIPGKPLLEEGQERKSSESFIPPHFPRSGPFYTGREPAASGVQPSNVTSAIRSQMISSTAAAPGAKAGLSKEVHGLKRKVLEKGTGSIAPGPMAAPQRPTNGSATQPHTNHTNSAVSEKNGRANEGADQSELAGTKRRREESRESEQKKPERKRDPKPGYCENCRDKFDDFEEVRVIPECSPHEVSYANPGKQHTMTRKHRRFAQNPSNWAELDDLLFEIQRPLKEEFEMS